ncbi:uncharacterized protein LOC108865076 [Galendromus occidentalis]|uniref:Uncharacterized protein LOC108865076 n=1 Tax=Galendromus occidentalis TaxID=34638 RepID=A0AAJ7L887_9ACAR|nr:uncharacterized protein LOC108865076 [Galendromus occidentalis]
MASTSGIRSQRGQSKLAHDGHLYVKAYASKSDTQSWRCMYENSSIGCKAKAYTLISTGEVVRLVGVHSDPPDPSGIEVARITPAIKRRREETNETPSSLVNSSLVSATTATLGQMTQPRTNTRMINRHRNSRSAAPANPDSRGSINIPEQYRTYESEPGVFENFLVADSGVGDPNRILIFGRESVSSWIGFVDKLYVDGTFSLTPPQFSQVFIDSKSSGYLLRQNSFLERIVMQASIIQVFAVLAERVECVGPVTYALLLDKAADSYIQMLNLSKLAGPALTPASVVMDYERAMTKAVRECFPPETSIHGCFFHLVENIKLRMRVCGVATRRTTTLR